MLLFGEVLRGVVWVGVSEIERLCKAFNTRGDGVGISVMVVLRTMRDVGDEGINARIQIRSYKIRVTKSVQ